jgi:tetratricopeptide (TPR) repeat protein
MKAKLSRHIAVLLLLLIITPVAALGSEREKIDKLFEESFVYEAQGKYTASLNSVLQILRLDHKNYVATLRAGWLSYLRGNYKESSYYYEKAVALAPHAIEPRLGLMLPLMAANKWKKTETVAQDIIKSDSKNYLANSRLAFILFSQKRYGDAAPQYRKVIDWYPSDIEMQLGLAWTFLRMGKKKEARRYFLKVLTVRRNNRSALDGMEIVEGG